MRLEWTAPAADSLQAIHDNIARDQPFYAIRFVERPILATERLSEFPDIGRRVPEANKDEIRELVFQGFRINLPSPR
jgi:plasmid stabilization system protein ParE